MIKFFHIVILIGALGLAGCANCPPPETLPQGSIPLTDGYGPVVKPQPVPVAVQPAPKPTYVKKRTYTKKRTTARKPPVKKAAVKKPVAKKKAVRKTYRPAAPKPQQVVPPIPMPLEEVQEAGRKPERLQ